MPVKSNIIPISNVHPLNGSLVQDTNFHKHVKGKKALVEMLRNIKGMQAVSGFHTDNIKHLLTPPQISDFDLNSYCSLLGDKEDMVFGFALADGNLKEQCRCYKVDCKHFSTCRPGVDKVEVSVRHYTLLKSLNDARRPINQREIGQIYDNAILTKPKDLQLAANILNVVLDPTETILTHKEVGSQTDIIEGDPERCMLVNAGPGTGKTYSLIEKIKYMFLHNDISPSEEMLVLCFTRTAVKEIKERYYKEIKSGELPGDLAFLEIRTFDSFATIMLNHCGKDVVGKDYEERIQMAIELLDEEPLLLENFKHIFIDEIQDLVGLRARFVKAILEKLHGGFTLLGDPMQGIYDYQIKDKPDELDSVTFRDWLHQYCGEKLETVSLSKNHRQNQVLTAFSLKSRTMLESGIPDQIQSFLGLMSELPSRGGFSNFELGGSELSDSKIGLLCRTNGEVLKLSGYLRKRGFSHSVKKQNMYPLIPSWITELLSSNDHVITLRNMELLNRTFSFWNPGETEMKFNLLRGIVGEDQSYVNRDTLLGKLSREYKLPEELYEEVDSRLCVTTIHQSKGREFDKVLLVRKSDRGKDTDLMEEAKVYYVAITRAKTQLNLIESDKTILSRSNDGRWYQTRFYGKRSLSSIEFGMKDDTDEESFVNQVIVKGPKDNQKYIRDRIIEGDEITLHYNGQIFHIVHNDTIIGSTSQKFCQSFKQAIREVYGNISYFPSTVEGLYVDKLYSVIRKPETIGGGVPEPFCTLGVWLGVHILGLGNVRWPI
ncbi:UvrD/REP helicase N-terminal domain-containing protein [Paenibacillus sp. 1_12]|uniref:UvrD-helicase domain-containing protein n=1 Tax=Paenibacillus sp. 1_12 TaxID=1566278 RepID=UPI0008EB3F7C|nr:UvrD-helicase domain-containing protein [Paenibacillus sp. 1_12]SFK75673.1 UvrD/REP helicase N-terminal domain-containing protein [Paenibacillus sp. 1_12]